MQLNNHPTSTPEGLFKKGDPVLGDPATVPTPGFMNAIALELKSAIEASGLALDPYDNTQLLQSLLLLSNAGMFTNLLDNPWMQIAQRGGGGAAFAGQESFTVDRWKLSATGSPFDVQWILSGSPEAGLGDPSSFFGSIPVLESGRATVGGVSADPNSVLLSAPGSSSGTPAVCVLSQIIERKDLSRGGEFSFSVMTRTGSNPGQVRLRVGMMNGAKVDIFAAQSELLVADSNWRVVSYTLTIPPTAAAEFLRLEVVSDIAGDTLELTGASLSRTQSPVAFPVVRPALYELERCQRYFESSSVNSVGAGGTSTRWLNYAKVENDRVTLVIPFRTIKRVPPTVTLFEPGVQREADLVDYNGTIVSVSDVDASASEIFRLQFPPGQVVTGGSMDFQWEADAEI